MAWALHQTRVLKKLAVCLQQRFRLPPNFLKCFSVLGLGFGLSEGGSLPSGVGGVSSKAAASIFVPATSEEEVAVNFISVLDGWGVDGKAALG